MACTILVPDLYRLNWEQRVLTTGLPGKSLLPSIFVVVVVVVVALGLHCGTMGFFCCSAEAQLLSSI